MQKYSGQLGFVLFPDFNISHKSYQLAQNINKNLIHFTKPYLPHISLYHSKIADLPEEKIMELLLEIENRSRRISLDLEEIIIYGQRFVFWLVKKTSELEGLHYKVLALSKYFVKEGKQQADREKIKISQVEQKNVKEYGHPFVKNLWLPHITLGYCEKPDIYVKKIKETGRIAAIGFVEIGDYGTIKRILISKRVR